jgi:hypothetical protein
MELGRLAGALMDSAGPATPRQWHPAAAPSGVQLMRDAIARRAKGTWGLVSAPDRRHRPHSMLRELREGLRAVGTRAPDVGLPAPRTAERRMELRSWQLDRVISIAHAHLVSVNDVALTMIAHGMGDLLSSRGVDITGLSLRVSIPVASPPGRHNVGGTPPIVVDLPIDQAPPATLHRISVQTSAAKTTWDRHHSGLATSELAPRFLVRLSMVWLRRHAAERINLYVTNVPGPSEPLSLAGYQLTSAFPLPPLIAGVPLAVGVLSYHGSLCVAVNTTPAVDLTPLADGLDAALDDLE